VLVCCAAIAVLMVPGKAGACPVCYGAADGPIANGMNMAIFTLLAVIGAVLAGFVAFFVFLLRRARISVRQSRPVVMRGVPEN